MYNPNSIIEYFNQLPLFIQIVWGGCVFMLTLILILIVFLKYYRNHLKKGKKSQLKYSEKFELLIVTYLYAGEEEGKLSTEQESILEQIKVSVQNEYKRKIFISSLQKLNNEISGEMADNIQSLYINVGLLEYSLIDLKRKEWHIAAKAIRELTEFKIKDVHSDVMALVNHKQSEVRKEVQLYVVNLYHFEGLAYLNDLKAQLSEWDQIQLLEILQRVDIQQSLDISTWLLSSNDSVVLFALKLAKIYNQYEAKGTIIKLLPHSSERVRVETIRVLNHLYALEVKTDIKIGFADKSFLEQMAVLNFIENFFDESDESLLLENVFHENFEIRLKALKILKLINSNRFDSLKKESMDSSFIETLNFIENN